MIGESLGNLLGHCDSHRVLGDLRKGWDLWVLFGKLAGRTAVLVVEVPITSFRFSGRGHEDIMFSPQATIVRLHQEVFFALGPSRKLSS